MNIISKIRTAGTKHIPTIVITIIVILVFWGMGFWALNQPDFGGGVDRLIYTNAARNFFSQEKLYLDTAQALPEDLIFFNYSPLSIFSVGLLSFLPPVVLYVLHFLAVVALFLIWKTIYDKRNIEIPIWIIPLWFPFSSFIYDAFSLNINIFMALLASYYLSCILKDDQPAKLGAILALFLLVTTKPQWGFFVLLPLVLRKWKFFLQIIAGVAGLYLLIFGFACILTSPGYVVEQHILFVKHLGTFTQRFIYWNLAPGPYEYNNSIHQVVIYLMGNIKAGLTMTAIIQFGLLVALTVMFAIVVFTKRAEKNSEEKDWSYLRWFFIFYCVTLLYPPLNFDFSLGIPMFIFLAIQGRVQRILIGIPLVIIAFQDMFKLILGSFDIAGWFPFIFTATLISLIFLLIMRPYSTGNKKLLV